MNPKDGFYLFVFSLNSKIGKEPEFRYQEFQPIADSIESTIIKTFSLRVN